MHVHVLPPDMASGHVALFRLPTLPSLHTLLLAVLKKKSCGLHVFQLLDKGQHEILLFPNLFSKHRPTNTSCTERGPQHIRQVCAWIRLHWNVSGMRKQVC